MLDQPETVRLLATSKATALRAYLPARHGLISKFLQKWENELWILFRQKLRRDPLEIFFQHYRSKPDNIKVSKSFPVLPR
jgi:hypothetical protein